ncbi:hypothetical protein N9L24_04465 [Candidatus Marinamargulisbacteria bacterium]|nr:hypothetical protein [Candidatus Marinamargulisbacteria bacterium]
MVFKPVGFNEKTLITMVTIQLTNGFGNNLFQYIAAKLLADHHRKALYVQSPPWFRFQKQAKIIALNQLGLPVVRQPWFRKKSIYVNEALYLDAFDAQYQNKNLILNGYFEDYRYFLPHINTIRSWFLPVKAREDRDLVIHMRFGDRLFYRDHYTDDGHPVVGFDQYQQAIESFMFDRLHIVTDMPIWKPITISDLKKMRFHMNPVPEIPLEQAVAGFNQIVNGFSRYNPMIHQGQSVVDDFNTIRSFKQILFQHGTMAWWAAVLSQADRVGVYGPWRLFKGNNNKNLSQMPLKGWFQWGK